MPRQFFFKTLLSLLLACVASSLNQQNTRLLQVSGLERYDTIRGAILTCAQTLTWVSLVYRTEPTTKKWKKWKTKKTTGFVTSHHRMYRKLNRLGSQQRRAGHSQSPLSDNNIRQKMNKPVPSLGPTCIGALGTHSRTGPLARTYLPGFPYSCSLRRLRQKISSIYCTVICNYPSAAQEQPCTFTVGLFSITKTVKLTRYALLVFVRSCSSINNKIISLKKIYWGPLKKKKNPGALGTCPMCPLVKTDLE